MSSLSQIYSYWSGNSTLTGAIPTSSLWIGRAPQTSTYPFAILNEISNETTYTSGQPVLLATRFQVSLYGKEDLASLEAKADTIDSQFDRVQITFSSLLCYQVNRFSQAMDMQPDYFVYQVLLEYLWLQNAT